MSYQVLARKWRPRTFEQVVGQQHVMRALANGLEQGRLHHAFLFTGTRGVGKTTIARILAKALNCEQGVSAKPCGECGACTEIDAGRFVDLLEIDAASRTGVDDIRELLDNVQYAAARGQYKVYLIDEVHMLSTHAFNALLKTLEEPPEHVKFLLATTDPQKLPITVLSRCLQFHLKKLNLREIRDQLAHILSEEKIESEPAALDLLARAAQGSLRDALSLLDQAIAYGAGAVNTEDVRAMLGAVERRHVVALVQAMAAQQPNDAFAALDQLAAQTDDYATILADLATLLQRVALHQQVPDALAEDEPEYAAIIELAAQLNPQETQLQYQIAVTSARDLELAPDPRTGLEMAVLRILAFQPTSQPANQPATQAPQPPNSAPAAARSTPPIKPALPPASPPPAVQAAAETQPEKTPSPPAHSAPPADITIGDWRQLVETLPLRGMVQQLAMNSSLQQQDDTTLTLALAVNAVATDSQKGQLEKALTRHFGRPMRLKWQQVAEEAPAPAAATPAQQHAAEAAQRQHAAEQAIDNDPQLQQLRETFDATLEPGSVQVVEPN